MIIEMNIVGERNCSIESVYCSWIRYISYVVTMLKKNKHKVNKKGIPCRKEVYKNMMA